MRSLVSGKCANSQASAALSVTVPRIAFAASAYNADEGEGAATIIVSLDAVNPFADVQVTATSSDGTAGAPEDYTAIAQTVTVPAGSQAVTFTIPLADDGQDELAETVDIALSDPKGGALGASTATTLTITDNDPTPTLSIDDVAVGEGDGTATFTVTLSAASSFTVTANFASSDGSASAGSDYTPASGPLTITAGLTTTTFIVPILEDVLDENGESFTATLSSPINVDLADGSAAGTIRDNDGTPTLSIADVTVGEGDGTATFTVTLSAVSGLEVMVDYATSDGSATAGSDYTTAGGSLTIAAGETTATFSVPIIDDAINESGESFTAILSSPINADVADGSAMGTIVDNDSSPTVSFHTADYIVGESDGSARITVTLSAVSGLDVTVDYATADSTATAGSDYTATSDRLTILAGEINGTFAVPIIDDTLDENDETILLTLSSPTVFRLAAANTATLTIVDNDTIVGPALIFLPFVSHNEPSEPIEFVGPDLVISAIVASPAGVQVTVRNQGDSPTSADFWVDLYYQPTTAPSMVNQLWFDLGAQGAAWGVTQDLAPGDELVLTLNDGFYQSEFAVLPAVLETGATVYAQADSWNPSTSYGAVDEAHEILGQPYNNIAQTTAQTGIQIQVQALLVAASSPSQLPARLVDRQRLWLPVVQR